MSSIAFVVQVKIQVREINVKLKSSLAQQIIQSPEYKQYFIVESGDVVSVNHEVFIRERLLNLVKSVGNEGLLGSYIPAIYLKQYGEKLELRKNDGSKVKLITLLGSLTDITMEQRDSQQIYYFNDRTTDHLTIQRQSVLKAPGAEASNVFSTTPATPSRISTSMAVVVSPLTPKIAATLPEGAPLPAPNSFTTNILKKDHAKSQYLIYSTSTNSFAGLNESLFLGGNVLAGTKYTALDLEGFNDDCTSYSLAQLSFEGGTSAILFDREQGKEAVHFTLYTSLLNAKDLQYIFIHDCHHDVAALSSSFVNELYRNNKCFIDTQLVYEYFHQNIYGGFNACLQFFSPMKEKHETKDVVKKKMRDDPTYWFHRPLTLEQVQYAALDVILLQRAIPSILDKIKAASEEAEVNLLSVFLLATEKRIAKVFEGLDRTIVFDSETFQPVSSELVEALAEFCPNSKYSHMVYKFDHPIQSFSSVKELVKLFPERYVPFLDTEILTRHVCDIVLDKGRSPYLRMMDNSRRNLFPDQPHNLFTTPHEDLLTIAENLSGNSSGGGGGGGNSFGGDNRAGVEGELHRISAIRSKKTVSPSNPHDNIIGLTIRIGYFVGNSYIISDLLFQEIHRGKSILVLGPPGSGKTSVIREIARQMSRVHHVMIVDTSNEICGDSDVPHGCVGQARRMMVPDIDDQHRVMIECVQNHTPEVMIIDEIGRTKEVKAAQTCKQRGVRLIASAHGDLRSLLKNGELNGLLGGVASVTLGDAAAAKTNHGNKVSVERGGAPIFDIVIEVTKGNYNSFRITMDSGKTVDFLLDGKEGKAEYRERQTMTSLTDEAQPQIISSKFVKI
eukprot:gene11426-12457_t